LQDLSGRISYLSSFLNLTAQDGEALLAAKPLIAPLLPAILDRVYVKLLSFDITAQAFVPRNSGYEGELVESVQELTLENPQIARRKDFLKNYLVKLVSTEDLSPNSPFWAYLLKVAIMHTGHPGFAHRKSRPELRVEYVHMAALLGYVVDIVVGAVLEMDIDLGTKGKVIRALNKVVWIQNDLFAWVYLPGFKFEGDGEKVNGGEKGEVRSGGRCPFSSH